MIAMLAFVMVLASCSKGPKTAAYISDNAIMVVNVNVKQLLDKADAKNLDNISFVKLARQELRNENAQLSAFVDGIIADPLSTGLDLRDDIVLQISENGNPIMIVPMHKEAKFEKFLQELASKNGLQCNISKGDNYKMANMELITINYNGDVAIIPIDGETDAIAKELFNLEKDKSLAKNKNFNAFWKERSEIGAWMNLNNLFTLAEKFGGSDIWASSGLTQEMIDDMRKGSYACNLVFDKGAIRFVCKAQGLKLDQYIQDFNGKLINYMPEKCLAAIAYSVKIEWISKMLQNSGEIDLEEKVTLNSDKTIKDMVNAFGGSILFSLFDITSNENGIQPMMALTADIKDANTMREIIEGLAKEIGIEKEGDMFIIPDFGIGKIMMCMNEKAMYVTNSTEAANQFSKGGYKDGMKGIASKVKKGNYFYADLNLSHYPTSVTSLIPENIAQLLSQYLDHTEALMLNKNDGEWAIYLNEKKENSLLATLHFVDNNLMTFSNLAESFGGSSYDDEEIYVEEVTEEDVAE